MSHESPPLNDAAARRIEDLVDQGVMNNADARASELGYYDDAIDRTRLKGFVPEDPSEPKQWEYEGGKPLHEISEAASERLFPIGTSGRDVSREIANAENPYRRATPEERAATTAGKLLVRAQIRPFGDRP